jgi:phage-related baseplate assembly protein
VTPPVRPDFLVRDPETIEGEIVAQLEADLGRILQPAQVEAVLGRVFAYRESLVRMAIQDAAEQNLVAFARAGNLDNLGELVGAVRLPAVAAHCTIRFTLVGIQAADVVIPAGTRVQSDNGKIVFVTSASLTIVSGLVTGTVLGTAQSIGEAGNGFAIGSVRVILDPVAFVSTAANDDVTSGGAEVEDDERYRERIREAPNAFSVAGSIEAYRYHAMSVSTSIIDVTVTSPSAGIVRAYVLTNTGIPGAPLLAQVLAALSADRVRPLTDHVEVVAPTAVNYTIVGTITLLPGADGPATLAAAQAAAAAYAADRSAGLGRDVVPSQIIAALSVPGVYNVALTFPALTAITDDQWANCTLINVTIA